MSLMFANAMKNETFKIGLNTCTYNKNNLSRLTDFENFVINLHQMNVVTVHRHIFRSKLC